MKDLHAHQHVVNHIRTNVPLNDINIMNVAAKNYFLVTYATKHFHGS